MIVRVQGRGGELSSAVRHRSTNPHSTRITMPQIHGGMLDASLRLWHRCSRAQRLLVLMHIRLARI